MEKNDSTLSQTPSSTLARLSFRVAPERMDEFEAVYTEKVLPILQKHGLKESSQRGRAVVEDVFCRLFEMKSPSEVEEKREVLGKDSRWQEVLKDLGSVFGTDQPDGPIQYYFEIYSAPGRYGKVVLGGKGSGHWETYDVTNGLAGSLVASIYQDRKGYLWFGTFEGGVSRYDGQEWTTFTTQDGLAHNDVVSIYQDREGHLWFGTWHDGVSRYDGREWTTFTTQDGLAHNDVMSIYQDREGYLWFATRGGGAVSS